MYICFIVIILLKNRYSFTNECKTVNEFAGYKTKYNISLFLKLIIHNLYATISQQMACIACIAINYKLTVIEICKRTTLHENSRLISP